jgi:alkylhydroperoxidase family enzyme
VGRSEGLTTAQLKAIRLTPSLVPHDGKYIQRASEDIGKLMETLGPQLTSALEFTDWSTKVVRVPDDVFKRTRDALGNDDTKMVELVGICGGYNFVGRLLVSLDVDGKADATVPIPQ